MNAPQPTPSEQVFALEEMVTAYRDANREARAALADVIQQRDALAAEVAALRRALTTIANAGVSGPLSQANMGDVKAVAADALADR